MTTDEVLKSSKLSGYGVCKKLKITTTNWYKWEKQNWIPLKQQFLINNNLGLNLPIDLDKESMDRRISNR